MLNLELTIIIITMIPILPKNVVSALKFNNTVLWTLWYIIMTIVVLLAVIGFVITSKQVFLWVSLIIVALIMNGIHMYLRILANKRIKDSFSNFLSEDFKLESTKQHIIAYAIEQGIIEYDRDLTNFEVNIIQNIDKNTYELIIKIVNKNYPTDLKFFVISLNLQSSPSNHIFNLVDYLEFIQEVNEIETNENEVNENLKLEFDIANNPNIVKELSDQLITEAIEKDKLSSTLTKPKNKKKNHK